MNNIPGYWQTNVPASTVTSMRCGGPLAYLAKVASLAEVQESLTVAARLGLPVCLLGGGSNLVFADDGFAGVVIQPQQQGIDYVTAPDSLLQRGLREQAEHVVASRYRTEKRPDALSLKEGAIETGEPVLVEMSAGVVWGQAVAWSLKECLSGLQWYARIPCRVGGAVYNNIHGQSHLLSEQIVAVRAIDRESGELTTYTSADLDFGYDHSRFHEHPAVIVSVVFTLERVSNEAAANNQKLYLDWTKEKARVQPSGANCGSVFKNLDPADAGDRPVAAGWYIDECGLRGEQEGGMQVYPGHANFIINLGEGTQADLTRLIRRIQAAVQKRFGIWLEPEVECLTSTGERTSWRSQTSA